MYLRRNGNLLNNVLGARCFWQDNMLSNIILVDDGRIKIGVTVIDGDLTELMDVKYLYFKVYK